MLATAKLQTIVCTANLVAAEKFYGEILGLPFKGKSDGAAVYEVGGADLRLSPVPTTIPSLHTVLGFAVVDIGSVVAQLATLGIRLELFPGFQHDASGVFVTPGGSKVAWFRDPDGNLLSVVECS